MNLTLSKLLCKISVFFIVTCSVNIADAQQIEENYIFYSPSDAQMGNLTFLNNNTKMFSNGNSLLLIGDKTRHLDTLNLSNYGFSSFIQNISVINDSLFSISTLSEFLKIDINENQFKVINQMSKADLRKQDIDYDQFIFLDDGFLTLNINSKRKTIKYKIAKYSNQFKKIAEEEFEISEIDKNDFSYKAVSYPHNYYLTKSNYLGFSLKEGKAFILLDLISFNLKKIDLQNLTTPEEGIEIFYNRADDSYYMVKYNALGNQKSRLTIYDVDPFTFDHYKLNELEIDVKKVRGGFHNGKMLLMDDFKGSLGFYLVPINDLHKI
ncbi:hypothetical protein QYS47_30550 [Marivirga arenosa]|uniref:TolB-like protein n=1 Tax=Marivirga arenosa TaxID=3059076 RepID=A0AA51ZXH9_9BACT|nr:hypothetical protein QYS47_30550 [Marivirga sp. BKB1-2]